MGMLVLVLLLGLGLYVQSMNDTRDIAQDGQQNIDQEVAAASALEKDTQRWEDDGKNDLADITTRQSKVSRRLHRTASSAKLSRAGRIARERAGESNREGTYEAVKGMLAVFFSGEDGSGGMVAVLSRRLNGELRERAEVTMCFMFCRWKNDKARQARAEE